jgi:hypothetical protein
MIGGWQVKKRTKRVLTTEHSISHIGNRPLHENDRRIHQLAAGTWRESSSGCAHHPALAAQLAVQLGFPAARSLKKAGAGYVHTAGPGGLRHPARDSLNIGW